MLGHNGITQAQAEMFSNGWDGAVMEDGYSMLMKALEAGSGADASTFTGGRSLIPESLDTTLVSVLWNQNEAKLFKALKRNSIKSPVHQWNKRDDVGDEDGAWVAEGGVSFEKNQAIARKFVEAKYLQTLRKVTLQMLASNSLENAEAIEKEAGALWIIKQIERALFQGDSSIITEQPDGLKVLIPDSNVIDLRGEDGTSADMEDAWGEGARIIRDNYGMVSDAYMPTFAMEDVQKLLRDRLRVPAGGNENTNAGAYVYKKYPTPFGTFTLEDNLFIDGNNVLQRPSTLTAQRPDQPSITLTRQAASGGRVSEFTDDDAGDYYYQVVAVNKFGDSVASAAVQVTGVVAGDEVKISVTDGAIAGTGYKIYRSRKDASDGSDCRLMSTVVNPGGGPSLVYDVNSDLPNTMSIYMLNMIPQYNAIEWEQWLPTMKFQLYPTNAAVNPFLMLLFGVLGLKKEEQMVRIKNVSYSRDKW